MSIAQLKSMVAAGLSNQTEVTQASIRELLNTLVSTQMFGDIPAEEVERLARWFEALQGVTMNLGATVKADDYLPWLPGRKSEITPVYWDRYRQLLVQQGFPVSVLSSMDMVTDRALGLLEDPKKGGVWDRRGMVVGHVQSGKTANYTGLICKAADAGYRVIIVIAGIHNRLRNQTQVRLEEGFVGHSSAENLTARSRRIGVGKIDPELRPTMFTTRNRDFNRATAIQAQVPLANLTGPALFVIKKNATTLQNLVDWLTDHGKQHGFTRVSEPMLLIDDEADNASINIAKGKGEVSRINSLIRSLVGMFDRSCYVGYTATPFANILIDPEERDDEAGEDLFPRDFIVSLDPPSNYFGPERVFGSQDSASPIRHIDDNGDLLPISHKKEFELAGLPKTLQSAVRAFALACAVRILRGHRDEHSSMLVNASRFTDVQRQLKLRIHHFMSGMKAAIRSHASLPEDRALLNPDLLELKTVWDREFGHLPETWGNVQSVLHEAVSPIDVIEVNSKSSDSLNYGGFPKGLSVIAVGGFSLSRGLTLEGLVTTYFLRNSVMYDTLMQMGRWFGYRPGYEDLCRIWMTEEAEGWYAHVAESVELLRDELRRMESLGATPQEFGLKVQSHPDALLVTARNKMGTGQTVIAEVDLAKNLLETRVLRGSSEDLEWNRVVAAELVAAVEDSKPVSYDADVGGFFAKGISSDLIIDFVSAFRNHEGSILTAGDPVTRYIRERAADELSSWDILLPSLSSDGEVSDILGVEVTCQTRTIGDRTTPASIWIGNKYRVASRGAEKAGLSQDDIRLAEDGYQGSTKNFPDSIYRAVRKRPLLILHLIKLKTSRNGSDYMEDPVVAWSISFPSSKMDNRRVEYVVNTVWLQTTFADDWDTEELIGDEE